jgi:hypothetical protein
VKDPVYQILRNVRQYEVIFRKYALKHKIF